MQHLTAAAFAAFTLASTAQAAQIDFTDATFTVVTANGALQPTVITESAEGVVFTIQQAGRAMGSPVLFNADGLDMGEAGDGMLGFTIVADQDVTYTSISGFSTQSGFGGGGGGGFLRSFSFGPPTSSDPLRVAYSAPGYGPFDVAFAPLLATIPLSGGGVEVAAGDVFFVDHTGFSGATIQGAISAIGFERSSTTPIPVPASLPLMLAGLGALAVRKRRSS